jgi:hypothetical protein
MPPRKQLILCPTEGYGSSARYAASGEQARKVEGQETDDSVQAHNIKENYDPGGCAV